MRVMRGEKEFRNEALLDFITGPDLFLDDPGPENLREGRGYAEVPRLLPVLLGRKSRKDLARDRQMEHRVSLRRIFARRHRLKRYRSRSWSTRQQRHRPFRS